MLTIDDRTARRVYDTLRADGLDHPAAVSGTCAAIAALGQRVVGTGDMLDRHCTANYIGEPALSVLDARADRLLATGMHPTNVWHAMCEAFPDAHSNIIGERVTAAYVANGGSL